MSGGKDGHSLDMNGGELRGNQAGDGGGLYITSSNGDGLAGVLTETAVRGNRATDGAGLSVRTTVLRLSSATVEDNEASRLGGGAKIFEADLSIEDNSLITANVAVDGGGVATDEETTGAKVDCQDSTLSMNQASSRGGGVLMLAAAVNRVETVVFEARSCDFVGNSPEDLHLKYGGTYTLGEGATVRCPNDGSE